LGNRVKVNNDFHDNAATIYKTELGILGIPQE